MCVMAERAKDAIYLRAHIIPHVRVVAGDLNFLEMSSQEKRSMRKVKG